MKFSSFLPFLSVGFLLMSCGKNSTEVAQKDSNLLVRDSIEIPETKTPGPTPKLPEQLTQSDQAELVVSVTRKTNLETDLSNMDQFSTDINTYVFSLKNAKPEWEGKNLLCINQRAEKSSPLRSRITYGEASIFLDSSNALKTSYECFVDGETPFKKFDLLKGFIIDKESDLSTILGSGGGQYNTGPIIIKPTAKLYINNLNFSLSTSTLVVLNDGKLIPEITTFKKEELVAPAGISGLSGGMLTINAEQTLGDALQVTMLGQSGGVQNLVPATPSQPPQAQGCYYMGDSCEMECNGGEPERCYNRCDSNYSTPYRGFDAYAGLQGFPGTNGGASGAFILNVTKMNSLQNVIFQNAGGKKGLGGNGGLPSQPGLGGTCPNGAAPSGREGSPGPKGQDGTDGIVNLSSVTSFADGRQFFSNGQQ